MYNSKRNSNSGDYYVVDLYYFYLIPTKYLYLIYVYIFLSYIYFSSARISKALNVDRVRPPNDDSQDVTQFGSPGDDLQTFIDEFDLMISNQDVVQF